MTSALRLIRYLNIAAFSRLGILLCCIVLFALVSCSKKEQVSDFPENTQEVLEIIDKMLPGKKLRIEKRLDYIDSVKVLINNCPVSNVNTRILLYDSLVEAYRHFEIDSLIHYSRQAACFSESAGLPAKAERYLIMNTYALLLKGHTFEALMKVDTTDVERLYPENRVDFLIEAWHVSLSALSFFSPHEVNPDYLGRLVNVSRRLVDILPQEHDFYPLAKAVVLLGEKNYTLAVSVLTSRLECMDLSDPFYCDYGSVMAMIEHSRANYDQWLYMQALITLSELKNLILDGEAMRQLCAALVMADDIDHSLNYLIESQADNAFSGAIMRGVHVSDAIPVISKNYKKKEQSHWKLLYRAIILMLVLVMACGIAMYVHFRNKKRLLAMHSKLEQANDRKEDNLGNFIALCASCMERIEDLNRVVLRKLGAGQANELHSLAKSGKFVDEQRRMFYDVFDEVFIGMYPTFVDEVNALCMPDKQIRLTDSGKLTPELRILAFMRLGTDDGSQIARLLGLSLNTVYTYRNRAKNRAVDRVSFETDIMKIGRIC